MLQRFKHKIFELSFLTLISWIVIAFILFNCDDISQLSIIFVAGIIFPFLLIKSIFDYFSFKKRNSVK